MFSCQILELTGCNCHLTRKKVGLIFFCILLPPCQRLTPNLVDAYDELVAKGDFEVVFISADEDVESFNGYFSKMSWLAVPFTDSKILEALDGHFKVKGLPHLVFLDENGKVLSDRGVMLISEYGAEGYPFTPERLKEIKEQEEEARRNQSLRSILESPSRDFVIAANGNKALVPDLEGKTIGLYFSMSSFKKSSDFTGTLVKVYNELKAKEEKFEVVMIPLDDDDEESFKEELNGVPWLSLPFKDKKYCDFDLHTERALKEINGKKETENEKGTHGYCYHYFVEVLVIKLLQLQTN
ncbi:hypothetical protein L6452_16928 [Arctium lappa]|uniref:Uncharacterized protein n=1 Tax=Arctium lappa TaxID=4217 RepID=A0ACB9C1Y2_ARCLA|nr:hypothetical protein L6452_16928 [Arctium lappa]